MSQDDPKEVKETVMTETHGKPAGVVDAILGNSEDGIKTDTGGDKIKETVPQDD
jgi:hypothetical protein